MPERFATWLRRRFIAMEFIIVCLIVFITNTLGFAQHGKTYATRRRVRMGMFCPPRLNGSMGSRRVTFNKHLERSNTALIVLWSSLSCHKNPRRCSTYIRLLKTLQELECVRIFRGMFPLGIVEEWSAMHRLCNNFRDDVAQVRLKDAHGLNLADPLENLENFLRRGGPVIPSHPCYLGALSLSALRDWSLDALSEVHTVIEKVLAASVLPLNGKKWSMFEYPGSPRSLAWAGAAAHRPGDFCYQRKFESRRILPNISAMLTSLRLNQKGWVVNMGAGDGRCLRSRFGCEAEDPANCLLHDGHSGLVFECNPHFIDKLSELFVSRNGMVKPIAWQLVCCFSAEEDSLWGRISFEH